MPDRMYRFRSVDNLLGTNGRKGELAGSYIYFAAPESLNDPLEGYYETFWAGDVILWENLLKHYITSLAFNYIRQINGIGDTEKTELRINTIDLGEVWKPLLEKLREEFTSNEIVQNHIRCLSQRQRKVKRPELQCHLQILNSLALSLLHSNIHTAVYYNAFESMVDYQALQQVSGQFLAVLKPFAEAEEDELQLSLQQTLEAILSTRFLQTKFSIINYTANASHTDSLTAFVSSFPSSYCANISKLNYPDWHVACFMSKATDSSIWGTYGDSHSAVCLIFNTDGEEGNRSLKLKLPAGWGREGIFYEWGKLHFSKVSYERDFVEIDFFNSLGVFSSPALHKDWFSDAAGYTSPRYEEMMANIEEWRNGYHENRLQTITMKTQDWMRENEYRLSIGEAPTAKDRMIEYDFNSLHGIIFGMRTSDQDKIRLIREVRRICESIKRDDFHFYEAHYSPVDRGLTIDLIGQLHQNVPLA